MTSLSALDTPNRQRLNRLAETPFIALAARVGRFEPPFQYLRGSKIGFDWGDRFLLNKCLVGEEDAIAARENGILYRIPEIVSGADGRAASKAYNAYFQAHRQEVDDFIRAEYPPSPLEAEYFEPVEPVGKPLELDQWLDEIIGGTMVGFGFDLKRRKRKKSSWTCRSNDAATAFEIAVDKGPGTMSASFCVPDLPYFGDVGAPFFFAQIDFPYADPSTMRAQIRSFFSEYARVFPHVIEAIEIAVPIRDAYLAGDQERAISLARNALQ